MVKIPSLQKKPTVKWTKQMECPICGALLEYTNLDVKQKMSQFNEIDDVITCPNCNKWFSIKDIEIYKALIDILAMVDERPKI